MGITDFFSDLYESMGFQEVHADAPQDDKDDDESKDEGGDDDKKEGGDGEEEGEDKEEGGDEESGEDGGDAEEGGDEEEEEEEEEDDEPVDAKEKLEADCARSSQCSGYKHHYDECVREVTAQHQDPNHKGPKEDCVEEFFHLQHCATQCAAPKLFKMLK